MAIQGSYIQYSKKSKTDCGGLSVCALIYNSPHMFSTLLIDGQCFAYAVDSPITKIYSWFSFGLNAIIPFTLLIYMSCIIVKTVQQSHKMFRINDTNSDTVINQQINARQKTMKNAEHQLTIMLLLVTTLFSILLCPTYIRFIYLSFVQMHTPLKYANSMFFFIKLASSFMPVTVG